MADLELSPEAYRFMRKQKIDKVQELIDNAGAAPARGVPSELAQVQATVALANVLMLVVERLSEISDAVDGVAVAMPS